jgi:hypothetical protein
MTNAKQSDPVTSRHAAKRTLGILALLFASAALARADEGVSRTQVQAQLVEAQRNGDIVDPWTKRKLNELYPSDYPAMQVYRRQTRDTPQLSRSEGRGIEGKQVYFTGEP